MEKAEQLENKKLKQTDKLTKAVLALTKRYEIADKKQIARDKLSIKDKLKEGLKDKLSNAFSLKSVAGLMGLGSGTVIGKMLDDRHDKKVEEKKSKQAEIANATKYAENNAKFNPESVEGKTKEAAIAHGVKLYKEQLSILTSIEKINSEISEASKLEQGESAKEYYKEELKVLKERLEVINKAGKLPTNRVSQGTIPAPVTAEEPAAVVPPATPVSSPVSEKTTDTMEKESTKVMIENGHDTLNELIDIRDYLMEKGDVLGAAVTQLETDTGKTITPMEKESLAAGIRAGMDEELLKINEEQLDALRKLVKSSEVSLEDKLEAKKKSLDGITSLVAANPKEKSKSILSNIMDIVEVFKKGGPMAGALAAASTLARGALSVGSTVVKGGIGLAKGAAGVGSTLIKGGADLAKSGVGKLATVAPGAAKGAASAAGGLANVAKKAGVAGAILDVGMGASDLIDGKAQTEMPSGWDVISPMRWGMYGGDKINKGVEAVSGGSSIGSMIGDVFKSDAEKKLDAETARQVAREQEIAKMTKPQRVAQSGSLEETIKREARIEAMKEAAVKSNTAAPTVVTNQNITNNKSSTVMAPPVRNFEPSYNTRLTASFV
jgi:hypothetical protein